jgi:hypothetical protein
MNTDFFRSQKLYLNWHKNTLDFTGEVMKFSFAIQEVSMKMGMNFQLLCLDSYLKFIAQTIAKSKSSHQEPIPEKRSKPDVERDLMAGSFHLLDHHQKML